jgi:hypothetical protein
MTISRSAVAGAVMLNIPTIFAASALSASAVAISAVVLAAVGAAIGAVSAWAITDRIDEAVAAGEVAPAAAERLAA